MWGEATSLINPWVADKTQKYPIDSGWFANKNEIADFHQWEIEDWVRE